MQKIYLGGRQRDKRLKGGELIIGHIVFNVGEWRNK